LQTARLEDDLTRVYSIGDFETVDFKIAKKDGKEGLVIDTKKKDWGPNYLRFGLNVSSDSQGDSSYALLTELRMTQLTKLGAEWRTLMSLGSDQDIYSELYAPLDTKNFFFVDPYVRAGRYFQDIYSGSSRSAEYEVKQVEGGVDFGVNFSSLAEGRIGFVEKVITAKVSTGNDPSLPEYHNYVDAGLRGRLVYDQLDNHAFPKNGIYSQVDFFNSSEAFGSDASYNRLEFNFSQARTYGAKHTVIGSFTGGTMLDKDAPYFDQFKLGGFLHLSGYAEDQLHGQQMGLARLMYYYKLGSFGPSAVLRNGVYVGTAFEAGNVWQNSSDISFNDLLLGGSVFLGFDSFFGPFYVGYGKTEGQKEGRFYIFLGKTF
jgi:NTE family protein